MFCPEMFTKKSPQLKTNSLLAALHGILTDTVSGSAPDSLVARHRNRRIRQNR
jgi:hypothetical protein